MRFDSFPIDAGVDVFDGHMQGTPDLRTAETQQSSPGCSCEIGEARYNNHANADILGLLTASVLAVSVGRTIRRTIKRARRRLARMWGKEKVKS